MSARHLYIHVPFCTRRCAYCDFAIAVRRNVPVDDYLRGVALELEERSAAIGSELETLYLGGGTPSRLGSDGVARLLDAVRNRHAIADDAEVTIEANPEDVSRENVTAWKSAGVNRVSLGVQSFSDTVLAWMHRVHSAEESRRAVDALREGGVTNFSLDLIFALPPEIERDWNRDLDEALELHPPHISLYGLTVEPFTPLARWQSRGTVTEGSEDSYAAEFLLADRLAASRGYRHYEVSNFAIPGNEARHNSAYWTGAEYVGIGPSAHSFDGSTRSWNVSAYNDWLGRLDLAKPAVEGNETLDAGNRAAERVYLGLRTDRGLKAGALDLEQARKWSGAGWARIEEDVVKLTPEGWLRLDSLAAGLTGF